MFDVEAFRHAVDITITAQEILVDNASYPTPRIAEEFAQFRPLGLGYANLGALLMSLALPYDSAAGRDMAGGGHRADVRRSLRAIGAHRRALGPFAGYPANREPMLDVIRMHRDSLRPIKAENVQPTLLRGRARILGRGARARAKSTATRIRRSPCSRPPAPSAS